MILSAPPHRLRRTHGQTHSYSQQICDKSKLAFFMIEAAVRHDGGRENILHMPPPRHISASVQAPEFSRLMLPQGLPPTNSCGNITNRAISLTKRRQRPGICLKLLILRDFRFIYTGKLRGNTLRYLYAAARAERKDYYVNI